MPRKLRLEYPGAIQHVFNRGNYRSDILAAEETKAAFEACLFEACEKSGWILHAFVAMRNHYHLALETPDGNLVAGMQWLQSTFASRFNRFRKEHGHLFQGRYKSILTEEGKSLGEVRDYINLNPASARIASIDSLASYRYSSYWYLFHPAQRPRFLRPQTALEWTGIPDTSKGWDVYRARLELQLESDLQARGRQKRSKAMCRGWAIGSDEFKASLVKEFNLTGVLRSADPSGVREIRQTRWLAMLENGLKALNRRRDEALNDLKSAPWKLALAAWMKSHTQVSNRWLSDQLGLGATAALSHNLTVYRRSLQPSDPHWRKLASIYVA